jgi:subtilase family serine protease
MDDDMKYLPFSFLSTVSLLVFLHTPLAYGQLLPISTGETPGSLSCIYGLTPYVRGCPISLQTVPTTGSGAIAVIDGVDDPNAFTELQQFSNQFNLNPLPVCTGSNAPCFEQYYVIPNASPPCISATVANQAGHNASYYNILASGSVEPEIDIEWSHAMAPYASLYMIETQGFIDDTDPNNPNMTSLTNAIQCAIYLFQQYNGGKGIVSYSDSIYEWAGETAYDSTFNVPGVIFIASSGDYQAPARYPAASPYVIAAGGTMIRRDSAGNYIDQVVWKEPVPVDGKTGATGGPSMYESRPPYQKYVQKIVGTQRGTPDISFVAQNVDVFCCQSVSPDNNKCCNVPHKPACETVSASLCPSTSGAWITDGGTSLASPALAGIINSANSGASTSTQELTYIYNAAIKNYHSYWTDITIGNNGYSALPGYDFTTGLGVPRGYGGK